MAKFNDLLKGTFLAQVLEIPKTDFVSSDDEIADGEVELGQMTDFEKQLLTFRDKKIDVCKEDVNLRANLGHQIKVVNELMWSLIRERYSEYQTIGVRKDFKVVSVPQSEDDCHPFSGFGFGVISISLRD